MSTKAAYVLVGMAIVACTWAAYEVLVAVDEPSQRPAKPLRATNDAAAEPAKPNPRVLRPRRPEVERPLKGDSESLEETLEAQREIIEQQEQAIEELEELVYGHREEWPPDTRGQTEDGVRTAMLDALRDCKMGDSSGVYASCLEPPCIAIVEAPTEQFKPWDLSRCPAWTRDYAERVSTAFRAVECDDGPVNIQLVAAEIPGWWDVDTTQKQQRAERLHMRFKTLALAFCEMREPG